MQSILPDQKKKKKVNISKPIKTNLYKEFYK